MGQGCDGIAFEKESPVQVSVNNLYKQTLSAAIPNDLIGKTIVEVGSESSNVINLKCSDGTFFCIEGSRWINVSVCREGK